MKESLVHQQARPFPDLHFRRVTEADRSRILDFTSHTWEDGDYIAKVFDPWLEDSEGRFITAVQEGNPVAIAKLSDLGEGELWLEGLRVDPAHRGQGIGKAMHQYMLALCGQAGGQVVRFSTGKDNPISQKLAEQTGFLEVGGYRRYQAQAAVQHELPYRLTQQDLSSAARWLTSPYSQASQGLYQKRMRWCKLSTKRLDAHLAAGEVYGWPNSASLRAWSICAPGYDNLSHAFHFDGKNLAEIQAMAQSLVSLAAKEGLGGVKIRPLDSSILAQALQSVGFQASSFVLLVYERQIP
jgi:RimJ/RimL family protein N-acetyltransferase